VGKRNSENYCPAKEGTFFGKKVLGKCAKVMPKEIQTRECFKQKDYAKETSG
jgi:hypothetical protein